MIFDRFSKITSLMLGVGVLCIAGYAGYWQTRSESNNDQSSKTKAIDSESCYRTSSRDRSNRSSKTPLSKSDYNKIFEGILTRNLGLKPEWESVPDKQNGFLQWLAFCDQHRNDEGEVSLKLPGKISSMISGEENWDANAVTNYFNQHPELLQELTQIGLLPEQSTHGISTDRYAFLSLSFAKESAELLYADARLAAESGDVNRALTRLRAAMGIGKHHALVETPSSISATAAILIDLNILEMSMKHVLPSLQLDRNGFIEWRQALAPSSTQNLAKVIQGEFWSGTISMTIPIVTNDPRVEDSEIKDAEALYDAQAQGYLHAIKHVKSLSYQDLWLESNSNSWWPAPPETLSAESKMVYELSDMGWVTYGKSFARAAAMYRYYDALFAIAVGDTPPVELITGRPFKYDASSRVLTLPDDPSLDSIEFEPIKVP